jgi:hypothetical protein
MSLGGYTAALLGTVTSDVDFLLSYIPIASIPDVMNDNDLVPGSGDLQRTLYEGYREQLVPITPSFQGNSIASQPCDMAPASLSTSAPSS